MTDLNERALLIARETIAKRHDADNATLIRSGKWDDIECVMDAQAGALVALVAEAEFMESIVAALLTQAGIKHMEGRIAASINYRNAAELVRKITGRNA
ncbi:hypothetical protein EVB53_115 [Rhizobium phage RHph_Y60]|nr:hypothetical protein EVB53_115 [Rhizobium phage RHph_Y60]